MESVVGGAAGPLRGALALLAAVSVLLAAASAVRAETLSGALYRAEVVPGVAGAAASANFGVCAGAGCMAIPPPAPPANPSSAPPANLPASGGGGGGGWRTPAPTPPPEPLLLPVLESASFPPAVEGKAPPGPTSAPESFVPPLPLSQPGPSPPSVAPLPAPLIAVAAAGALAGLLLLRGVARRAPGAAEGEVAVAPGTELIGGLCPFCGDLIKGAGLVLPCPSCRAVHHAECWRENGGCTTLGCARAPARPGAAQVPE